MPLTPTRAALLTGPGKITRSTFITHCKDMAGLKINQRYSDVKPGSHGLIDRRLLGQDVALSFTPAGYVTTAMISALWGSFASAIPGASLVTSADVPTTVIAADGTGTIKASAITSLPDIILGPEDSFMGSMTIRGVVGTGLALTATGSLYTYAAGSPTFADANMTAASFKQQAYIATFNSISFEAQRNWIISFSVETADVVVAGNVRDIKYTSLEVMARCVPVGHTPAELLTLIGLGETTTVPGRAQGVVALPLVITGTDASTIITIPLASAVGGGFKWSAGELRQDEIGFFVSRSFTAGVPDALYTIAV